MRIAYGRATGTAFLHSDDAGSAFITAAHNLRTAHVGDRIAFRRPGEWTFFQIGALAFDDNGYDVAAFSLADWHVIPLERDGRTPMLLPGDEVKFLGFPHGLENTYPGANGFCTPLVRTAFFSGSTVIDGRPYTILDGFNNPGFSGGPVYWAQEDGSPTLMGVISGYRHEQGAATRIYKRNDEGEEQELDNLYLKPNSGMIYASPESCIRSIMKRLQGRMPPPTRG